MGRFFQALAQRAPAAGHVWNPGLDPLGTDQVLDNSTGSYMKGIDTTSFLGYNYTWTYMRRFGGADGWGGYRWHVVNAHAYLHHGFTNWPYSFRARTLAVTEHTTDRGISFWGIGGWWDTTEASLHGIGFYAVNGGNWFAIIKDDTTTHLDVDTGVVSGPAAAHELTIVLDGRTRTATLSIDGAVVATQVFSAAAQLAQLWNDDTEWHPVGVSCWGDAAGPGSTKIYFDPGARDAFGGMLLGSSDVVVAPPVISTRITYQRILNLARGRAPEFIQLVIDDQQIMDELNNLTLELIQEGSDADHSAFQETVNWLTDIFPSLPVQVPAATNLLDFDDILLPSWVNSVYAMEGIKSDGHKVQILLDTKDEQIRNRPIEDESVIWDSLRDPRRRQPQAYKIWDPAESVWRFSKNTDYYTSGQSPWSDIVDANIVVSGVRLPMSERADLTDAIPVPFRALKPLTEAYALILGGRAGKDRGWMQDQDGRVEREYTKFREFINVMDMNSDVPFDPEIGFP
ncbi:MAG: hypothetical protein GY906_30085 [bacterium]|nr:hypothetical protein [bacterium]